MVRFRNSYIKAGMGSRRVTTLSPSFIDAKGVALIQSRTLSCMDAAAKPLIQKHGWVHGVLLLLPLKCFDMLREGSDCCAL